MPKNKVRTRATVKTKLPAPSRMKMKDPGRAKTTAVPVKKLLQKSISALIPEIVKEIKNDSTISKGFKDKITGAFKNPEFQSAMREAGKQALSSGASAGLGALNRKYNLNIAPKMEKSKTKKIEKIAPIVAAAIPAAIKAGSAAMPHAIEGAKAAAESMSKSKKTEKGIGGMVGGGLAGGGLGALMGGPVGGVIGAGLGSGAGHMIESKIGKSKTSKKTLKKSASSKKTEKGVPGMIGGGLVGGGLGTLMGGPVGGLIGAGLGSGAGHLIESKIGKSKSSKKALKKSFLNNDNSKLTSSQLKTVRDNDEYHEEIVDTLSEKNKPAETSYLDKSSNVRGFGGGGNFRSSSGMQQGLKQQIRDDAAQRKLERLNLKKEYDIDLVKSRHQASLRIEKAINYLQGYAPMDDEAVRKSFHGQIPEIMKEIEYRPPQTWWNNAIKKSSEFDSDPIKYSLDLWYDGFSKAVAEEIDSEYSPEDRGENEELSDGAKLKVSDIAGEDKSESDVSN